MLAVSRRTSGDIAPIEISQQPVFMSVCIRRLVLATSVMTLLLLMITVLIPSTPTVWVGKELCAAALNNRKYRGSLSASDSLNATETALQAGHMRFVITDDHLCDPVVDDDGLTSLPEYVIIVHSRRGQRGRMQRDAIRITWGSPLHRRVAVPDIRLTFVLGRDEECVNATSCRVGRSEAAAVRRESRLYRDIIVADFVDTYGNLSLKSLSGMYWARQHCRHARYVVKVDDDVYMRPEMLPRIQRLVSNSSSTSVIVGSLNANSAVQRRGLWRVDHRTYSPPIFPPYCSGNIYAMTSAVVDRLLLVAREQSVSESAPFPLEDVYITALLATSSGVQCMHDDAFPRWDVSPSVDNVERLRNGSLLAVHNVYYTQMYDIKRRLSHTS